MESCNSRKGSIRTINPGVTVRPSKYTQHHEASSFLACFTANRALPNNINKNFTEVYKKVNSRKQNKTSQPGQENIDDWNQDRKFNTNMGLFCLFVFLLLCLSDETIKDAGTARPESCRLWTEPNTPFKVALKDICTSRAARIGTHSAAKKISQQSQDPMRWTGGPLSLRFKHAFSWVPKVFPRKNIWISLCDEPPHSHTK